MNNAISKVLFTQEEILNKVKELGRKISEDYKDKEILLVCILKGAFVFAADLLRAIESDNASIQFMVASSYGDKTISSGHVIIKQDIEVPLEGKHVIIAEDIIDTGRTLSYVVDYLKDKGAESVEICTIFDKPERREVKVNAKYIGFVIPDEFVVGYGLDYSGYYRNLPYLGILDRKIYENC